MAYRLQKDESVIDGIKRIACEQIDRAVDELGDDELDRHETVHQVRKRCKKIRGVVRLVRPALGSQYRFENAWFRDIARELSYLRDAQALIETYDQLMKRYEDQIERRNFAGVRRTLTLRKKRLAADLMDLDKRLAAFREYIHEARERIETWSISSEGFDAIDGGLKKTYKRGRKAMKRAYENSMTDLFHKSTTERFHEWRKRVKYHWYHFRLLQEIWKPVMPACCDALSDLSDLLGDDHDLAVFRQTLLDDLDYFGNPQHIQALIDLMEQHRAELQAKAKTLGQRVFAEKPKRLSQRLSRYWTAWREE